MLREQAVPIQMSGKGLKIIFLVEYVHEQGTYFRWHNLAIGLQAAGHQVIVFGVDWDKHSTDRTELRDGVEYRILSTFRGLNVFTPSTNPLNFLRRFLLTYPHCDIVHTFQPFPFSAYLGWYLKSTGKANYFFYDWDDLWTKGYYDKKPIKGLSDKITFLLVRHTERRFPSCAGFVTVCSNYLRELAETAGAHFVSVIHNGFWPFEPIDQKRARTQLGLQPNAVYAGFMGRTTGELSWCIAAIQALHRQAPDHDFRLALCGMMPDFLDELSDDAKSQIDYLGNLSPLDCRLFAAAIDFGLLPLEDNAFNQSRFPIKFAEYQASGTPVIFSEVGECNKLGKQFNWTIPAGTTSQQFIDCFVHTLSDAVASQKRPVVNQEQLAYQLSWTMLAQDLASDYLQVEKNTFQGK